jgi:AcrR family transcriptional regulator
MTSELQEVAAPTDSIVDKETDGRRQRSERSRDQIIEAVLELIGEGDFAPSAARVAKRARVGLRTVFRHFEDMDSLYRGMTERVEARVMPKVTAPYAGTSWQAVLREHVSRRASVFEEIFPYRIAANLRRFHSRFLMEDYHKNTGLESATLSSILPAVIRTDAMLFAALELLLGFQSWRRLRQEQGFSAAQAEAVIQQAVEKLVRDVAA